MAAIEETIHIHDKYQYEIKLGYQLTREKPSTIYDIETYLFFPNSLGINRQTYSNSSFYQDVQSYIRLKTPTVLLQDMTTGPANPLTTLRTSFEQLVSRINPTTIAAYEYQIKMFCCIFKSAIRDHVAYLLTREQAEDIDDLLKKYVMSTQGITTGFRALRSIINVPLVAPSIFSIYAFGDEYLSILIETYTYEILEELKSRNLPDSEAYTRRLLAIITHELEYRQLHHYSSIPDADSTNEELIFRASVLKKYMGNVLFLNTRIKREGEFLEHIAFALAAGIAMICATSAAFWAQSVYASVSLPLFLILVISYMFKDRLKDVIRLYLGRQLRHLLFDHKMHIYSNTRENIGWCKESIMFLKEENLPPPIMKLRNRDHITEIENDWVGEQTILYRKRIKLFRRKLSQSYHDYQVESVNDIMRFNVLKFLSKMDNPKKSVYVIDEQTYRRVPGKRVYHMNMIIKYSTREYIRYKRFRLVLSRNGIKRIEEVAVDEAIPT